MKFVLKKDLLLKYKFWILLGVEPVLILIPIYILATSVTAEIAVQRKKIDDERTKMNGVVQVDKSVLRNEDLIKDLKEKTQKFKAKEADVWENAWKKQKPLFFWPEAIEEELEFTKGWFAEEIRINVGKRLTDLPKDEPNLVHGTVVTPHQDYLIINDRGGRPRKIFPTTVLNVQKAGSTNKLRFWDIKINDVVSVFYQEGKFFGDPFTPKERSKFALKYRDQIWKILEKVDPVTVKGDGVVQLGNWLYERNKPPGKNPFFFYLDKKMKDGRSVQPGQEWNQLKADISEEIWIAQEDLWIQSEIYSLIRKANDSVSKFEGKGGKEANKDYHYKNPLWDIILKWDGALTLDAKFTNLLPRRQRLGFKLRVFTGDKSLQVIDLAKYEKTAFYPHGTPGDTQELKLQFPNQAIPNTGIFEVEQVLNWETAAVRRIEGIYISQLGEGNPENDREYPTILLGYNERRDPKKVQQSVQGPTGGPRMGGPGSLGPVKDAIPGCIHTPTVGGNGFIRERYSEVKPESKELRRLPVAVVLIVEQGQVDRVQTAFNNSDLRFLTTQLQIRHYPFSVRPRFRAGASKTSASNEEMEANVELVIYGTVTIYERYPERARNLLK